MRSFIYHIIQKVVINLFENSMWDDNNYFRIQMLFVSTDVQTENYHALPFGLLGSKLLFFNTIKKGFPSFPK